MKGLFVFCHVFDSLVLRPWLSRLWLHFPHLPKKAILVLEHSRGDEASSLRQWPFCVSMPSHLSDEKSFKSFRSYSSRA